MSVMTGIIVSAPQEGKPGGESSTDSSTLAAVRSRVIPFDETLLNAGDTP
jgi:hypothetical protein